MPLFNKISQNTFLKNVFILVGGAAGSQAIVMGFSPFITRLYGPEIIGYTGAFMAVVAIVSPISALTYPIAIVLPKKDLDSMSLIWLSAVCSVVLFLVVITLLIFLGDHIVDYLNLGMSGFLIYLFPFVILISTLQQVLSQWLIRKKCFFFIAKVTIIQVLILSLAKVILGFVHPDASLLIFLNVIGMVVFVFLLLLGVKGTFGWGEVGGWARVRKVGEGYSDFPRYRAPQVMISVVSQSIPILMLAYFFGPTVAGFYSLARTVVGVPMALIGKAVNDVFYPKVAEAARNGENVSTIMLKTMLMLVVIGVLPFSVIIYFGGGGFVKVFGEQWFTAGEYGRWLAITMFFALIVKPYVCAVPVLGLQKWLLKYEILSTLAKTLSLFFGFYFYNNEYVAIVLFSIFGVVSYVYLMTKVTLISRRFNT